LRQRWLGESGDVAEEQIAEVSHNGEDLLFDDGMREV
jgi:hypothetical protein